MWLTFTLGYAFKNVGPDFHYRPPVFYLSQSVIKLRKNGEYCVSHDLIISCITDVVCTEKQCHSLSTKRPAV